ncbi:MAG TPA: TolC family protein [Pyrinomonadaceae bacterium]|jgi:HAE1 family hydrophobic/amphiphilic exporter-1
MSNYVLRRIIQASLLSLALSGTVAYGQTPTATPPTSPAQRDATRPPGTERNQPVPEQARPTTQDPTAPPGTTRPDPQAPPGTTIAPAPGVISPTTIPQTGVTTDPASGAPMNTTTGGGTQTPGDRLELRDLTSPNETARPVPPLPNLTRLGVTSDNTLTLSLNDAIRRALENNNNIEVARNDVRINETTLRSLEGIYDPVFNLNPQINNQVQSQQSSLGGGTTVTTTDLTGNTSVDKFFSTGGGQYSFFFNNNRRTTNNSFNALNPVYSASLGVTFTQPLWRDRSIDRNRRDIRIQRKRLEQSDADFRRQTIDVIAQVQRAYWDLVFALRDQQNLIANLNLSRELFRQTEARVAAGASAPLERAEVQTELANRESSLLLATQNVSIAENNLKQLIIREPNAPEWTAQITPTDQPSFDATPLSLQDAMAEARANRPELRRLRLQRDINDIDIKFFKNQTRPRLDLQSTLALTGLAGSPVDTSAGGEVVPLISGDPTQNANAFLLDQINIIRNTPGVNLGTVVPPTFITPSNTTSNLIGGYGRTLRNLFSLDTRNVVVGLVIQIPFRNRTAEANLAGARIQRTQLEASTRLQEQSVEVEVRNAAQSVETARRRVLSARAARQNAELQLQGEQRLYAVGRSTTFLLFQRENTLNNARNLELRAETDYNKALADLQRATSTTLRANNVIVDAPSVP